MPVKPYNEQAIMDMMMDAAETALTNLDPLAQDFWDSYVPVDTGNLRDTWQTSLIISPERGRYILLLTCGYPSDKAPDGAYYAVFVEFGTSSMEPRAPLRLTGDAAAASIPLLYAEACKAMGLIS